MPLNQRRRQLLFFSLLPLAFLFRLFVGLCSQFRDPDTKQTYLLGLKFYTIGAWPYFGPDVTNNIQIPGALQCLVVVAYGALDSLSLHSHLQPVVCFAWKYSVLCSCH